MRQRVYQTIVINEIDVINLKKSLSVLYFYLLLTKGLYYCLAHSINLYDNIYR